MTVQELAREMNQSEADVAAFVNCLSVWTSKGYSIEQAVSKHMEQMGRMVNASTNPALQQIAVSTFFN